MIDGPEWIEYRPPQCDWHTRNRTLDALLKLWRREQRPDERRQPRWSEIAGSIRAPLNGHLVLVGHNLGLRAPFCVAIQPVAASLLGLPPDFQGTAWAGEEQARVIGSLALTAGLGQGAISDTMTAVVGAGAPGAVPVAAGAPRQLAALAVPLAPEPASAAVVPLAFRRPVLLAVAWARRERWWWWG
jgi:hypothetical protein